MAAYEKQTWVDGETITKAKLDHIEEGIANIELTPGKTGSPGIDGRRIEIRKSETNLEWKYTNEVEPIVDFTTANTQIQVNKADVITKLRLVNVSQNAVYAQIKTVTVFGINAEGKPVANINPSISTMPEGTSFPCFEGFDPSKKEIDISKTNEIDGNMSIKTVIDEMLPQFGLSQVVGIDKIYLWVSLLNKEKEELGMVIVKVFIENFKEKSIDTEWRTLVALSELTGPTGPKGADAVINKLNKVDVLDGGAEVAVVVTAFNNLIADLKAKGLMNES
nr:hypothetical protein [Clostridium paraputrificum]